MVTLREKVWEVEEDCEAEGQTVSEDGKDCLGEGDGEMDKDRVPLGQRDIVRVVEADLEAVGDTERDPPPPHPTPGEGVKTGESEKVGVLDTELEVETVEELVGAEVDEGELERVAEGLRELDRVPVAEKHPVAEGHKDVEEEGVRVAQGEGVVVGEVVKVE